MALGLQRLGLGEAHQLLALGLRRGEQEFTVGLTASLLAHGVGFTFRLNFLALRYNFGLPPLLLGLLDFRLGNRCCINGSAILFREPYVVDLEVNDAHAEQIHRIRCQRFLHSQCNVPAMGSNLRNVDLAHFALEAVNRERFKVCPVVAVASEHATDFVLVDAKIERYQGVELLVVTV